jgi:chromosome segregation ATPase
MAVNRRDEATSRVRRMTAHLEECDALLERAGELTNAAEAARRNLDARRADVAKAHDKLALIEEQRAAAAQMIEDAADQLHYLEAAELDETSLRRELEMARHQLRAAEGEHAEAAGRVEQIQQAAAGRAASREHIYYERGELAARLEAPLADTGPLQEALAAFDAEALDQVDPVADELANEWTEVEDELNRITAALPDPPSPEEIELAERRLDHIENTIIELEAASHQDGLAPEARQEIEAAHEAVLAAEELLDDPHAYDEAVQRLQQAREAEQAVLHRYGYETYLDVILAEPGPGGGAQAELLDALRARRVAEDTLTQLRAAAEPPAILGALQVRRERILREAIDLLGCDPGDNVADLLRNHPVVPPACTRALADELAVLGYDPVGMAVRDAAVEVLVQQDEELAARDECRREIERLDRELEALDEEDALAAERSHDAVERANTTMAEVDVAAERVQLLEAELRGRTSQDERRLQRIAAAEDLRKQINAVTEALDRSNEETHAMLASAEREVGEAEREVEAATSALSDAVRRLQRIAEALPPALRPRPGDDPLRELPRLHETLAAEVDRAETALAQANRDVAQAETDIEDLQTSLDRHLDATPSDEILDEDLLTAVRELVGQGDTPVVLDDLFAETPGDRARLLDELLSCSQRRPVVLLTDDPDVLGWAIGLPSDLGTVTRLWSPAEADPASGDVPLAAQPGPVA